LRAHPDAADAYVDLKRRLAATFNDDIAAYRNGKGAFVEQAMVKAANLETHEPEPSGLAQEGQIPSGRLGIAQGMSPLRADCAAQRSAGLAGSSSKQAKRVGEPWQAPRAAERRGGWQSGQLGITHGHKPHELLPVLDEEWPFATMRRDGRI
jgi:hypothetical protein